MRLAEISLRDTLLTAPITGVVLERVIEAGSLVGVGTPAFVLGDVSSVKALFGVPDSRRQLYKWWYAIQKAAGINQPYYTFHEIRKTCGTAFYEQAPGAAQAMLEHSSIVTTMKYYANCDPILMRAVENLDQPAAFTSDDGPDEPPDILPFPKSG